MAKAKTPKPAKAGGKTQGAALLRKWFKAHPEALKINIARDIGVSKSMLGHYLADRGRPTHEFAVALDDLCGIPHREWLLAPHR